MKKRKRIWLLHMVMVLILSAVPIQAHASVETPSDMTKIAENEYLTLFLNEEDTSVAIVDNATGKTWYTNPPEASEDPVATAYYQKMMKSQLQVQYYNDNVQSSVIDNYNESIANGQFAIEELDDGVTITYTIGAAKGTMLLPETLSEERYQYYFALFDESEQKKINRNYVAVDITNPSNSEEMAEYIETYPGYTTNFYVLRGGVRDYLKEEMEVYFIDAGYTAEDLEKDMLASGIGDVENEDPWFIIPLTYRLDGKNLVVSIDPYAVQYNEMFYPVHIDVLPYFGATDAEEGYLFVPDGSGALIYLNNGKTNFSSYMAMVYGQDESKLVLSDAKSEIDQRLTIKMPVYGVKAEDQALFAVIESGSAYSKIAADISGRTTSYNQVYAGFNYLQYGQASLSDMVGANGYQLYSDPVFAENYQIRYSFLAGDDANYSGMAACYREYLVEKGILEKDTETKELPFYTEYIGAINKDKSFLGIKYDAVEALTTFAQAEQIVQKLADAGVESQKVIYSGWANDGLHGTAGLKQKAVSVLQKDGIDVKEFQARMKALEADAFMTMEMQYVYKDKLFDGYSSLQYAPGYFDHSDIVLKSYFATDNTVDGELADLVSPYFADRVADGILDGMEKYDICSINLGSVSNYLYSDFLEERYTDRQMAVMNYTEAISEIAENSEKIMGDNSNDYVWAYTDYMVNAPLYSNGYQILDEDIPFYEMVLHGYIQYAGEALNMSDDYRTTLLKSVECGAGLYYQWIYEDNSILKETDFDYLYSVYYGNWIEQAINDYQTVSAVLEGLADKAIVQHERIKDVARTTYEDGTIIYVNYGNEDALVDGIQVKAEDFAVKKGSD